jgi:glucose uptake protein GlcU
MVRILFSALLAGIAGIVAIGMLVPLLIFVSLSGLVPEGQVPAVSGRVEELWLLLITPAVMFLTGALATRLARDCLCGLTDCFSVSFPAGIITLLPGIVIFMAHFPDNTRVLLAGFSAVMLLASIAGSFTYYYFYNILPSRRSPTGRPPETL